VQAFLHFRGIYFRGSKICTFSRNFVFAVHKNSLVFCGI